MTIPILEISLATARGMLTVAVILVGVALALFIASGAMLVAARSWYRASKGELTSPPEDDIPSEELLYALEHRDEIDELRDDFTDTKKTKK